MTNFYPITDTYGHNFTPRLRPYSIPDVSAGIVFSCASSRRASSQISNSHKLPVSLLPSRKCTPCNVEYFLSRDAHLSQFCKARYWCGHVDRATWKENTSITGF